MIEATYARYYRGQTQTGSMNINLITQVAVTVIALKIIWDFSHKTLSFRKSLNDITHTPTFESWELLPLTTPIPETLEKLEEQALALGFTRYNVAKVMSSINPNGNFVHIYADVPSTVLLYLPHPTGNVPLSATFDTWFTDDAVIITRWPRAIPIDSPDFVLQFAIQNLQNAHTYHLQKVAEWTEQRGRQPVSQTMEKIIQYALLYNKLYFLREHEPYVSWVRMIWIVALSSVIIPIIGLIIFFLNGISQIAMFITVLMPIMIYAIAMQRYSHRIFTSPPNPIDPLVHDPNIHPLNRPPE